MNEKLNIQGLVELLAAGQGLTKKDADIFVKEFFLLIEEGLRRDRYVKIRGLGVFKLIDIESRESVNVNTGERFQIDRHTKISFTPDNALRDLINKPFAHFQTVPLNEGVELNEVEETDSEEITEKEADIEEPQEELIDVEKEAETTPSSPASPSSTPAKEPNNSTLKYFITMVILLILMCGGAIAYMYWDDIKSALTSPSIPTATITLPATTEQQTAETAENDTVLATVATATTTTTTTADAATTTDEPTPPPFEVDSTGYIITGTKTTHTVRYGETLTRISLRYYGTKGLYPYIVMHNKNSIKNPNQLVYNTVLQIPELRKK
ncbi:MAG: HU family DNA-binding protein [Mediterranea sp.]|jgi:nucleoid DNA-binding protein/nucleoid-associated protein YgaU|nr:HU family DNA-binding protein [Mediterranea sp.]